MYPLCNDIMWLIGKSVIAKRNYNKVIEDLKEIHLVNDYINNPAQRYIEWEELYWSLNQFLAEGNPPCQHIYMTRQMR
tara:strand:- start:468 stop:701 length:234 start_codon:yes stop_codon:yes gene_type:complete